MMEAVLSVKIPESWVDKLLVKMPSLQVTFLDVIPFEEHGVRDLVQIGIPDGTSSEDIIKTIKGLPGVENFEVERLEKDKMIGIVANPMCIGCRAMRESNVFLVAAVSDGEGRIRHKIIFSQKSDLQKLVWKLNEGGVDVKLVKLATIDEGKGLTAKQEQIIKVALDRGYYDFPKRIGIRELSEMFDVSTASLSETLRRGQRKIIEGYFEK